MRTGWSVLWLYLASVLPAAALADESTPPAADGSPAEERLDNLGKLGIGYQLSLGGSRGLSLRFGAGPIVVSGMFAFRMLSPDEEDAKTRYGLEAAVGVAIPLQRWNGTHFGIGLRGAIGTGFIRNTNADARDASADDRYVDPFGLAFELPVYVEAWLSQRITMLLELGVVFNVVGDEGSPLNERPAGLGLGVGTGGLFGSAAVHYYVF